MEERGTSQTLVEPRAPMYTVEDVAHIFRMSTGTVYNRAADLGAVHVGRLLRFPRETIDRIAREGT